MKKRNILIALGIVAMLVFTACGGGNNGGGGGGAAADGRTLDHFVQAFEGAGYDLAHMDTPLYPMIGAVSGVIFYIDNMPISIYEFTDTASLNQAFANFAFMDGWPTNGRFVIEASAGEIRDFFVSIEQ
jgi:hypothetical protein